MALPPPPPIRSTEELLTELRKFGPVHLRLVLPPGVPGILRQEGEDQRRVLRVVVAQEIVDANLSAMLEKMGEESRSALDALLLVPFPLP